jgi:hypothetical protein
VFIAGLGRTGTFVVVHYILERAKNDKSFHSFNVPNILLDYRKQRALMVQSTEQLEFMHFVLSDGLHFKEIGDLKANTKQATTDGKGFFSFILCCSNFFFFSFCFFLSQIVHYQKFDLVTANAGKDHYRTFEQVKQNM